jgi:hypothetical protein
MRELCYGQKSRFFDRRVEAMIGKAPVGGHQLRRKAKSRNRTLIARGTGSPR